MGPARPLALVAVVVAVLLEAVLLVGVAVFIGVETLAGDPTDLVTAAVIGVLALLTGVFLAVCARGLWRGRRWARAPVVTWQLLMLLAVLPTLGEERWPVAVGLLALCLVAGVGPLLPSVVARTNERSEPPVA